MKQPSDFKTVGVVGVGLIGGSWAAYFLKAGLDVRAYDPDPDAEKRLRTVIDAAMADMARLGVPNASLPGRLTFCSKLANAIKTSDFVQENGPENIDLKREVLCEIDTCAAPDVVIASSTSALLATDLQVNCAHPERVLVAHPFNPPHLLPLVEIVRGKQTSPNAQNVAFDFFTRIGKSPIRVKKEAVGHVANRMTAALWREAVHIVAEGIATVDDVDRAIRFGPGLRWAIDGPHMTYHLGGGSGGMPSYLDHLGAAQEARWENLGNPTLSTEVKELLVDGIRDEAAGRSIATLRDRRDTLLIEFLRALRVADSGPEC
jgi:carnitine 3-dehydrogenase